MSHTMQHVTAGTPTALAELAQPQKTPLALAIERRGLDSAAWNTLTKSLFPGAKPESVLLVVDYCRARKLDPLKKPCHIVPMRVKDQQSGQWDWRDVVMPGIYEYRTTAQRTGEYRGHSKPEFGPDVDFQGVRVPEWCALTILRGPRGVMADEFPVTVYFTEIVGTDKDGKINDRWRRSPRQMLEKCAEAAGLRKAFPDELGGEQTLEELEGRDLGAGPGPVVVEIPIPQARPAATPAASAPVTSQAPSASTAPERPAMPTTPNTAFQRDRVRIVAVEAKRTADKTHQETGEVTKGKPFALVTLSTGEAFQCWHLNTLVPNLETWRDEKTVVDLDCTTSRDPQSFRPRIEKGAPA